MNFFTTIALGLKEVWSHKFRSLLTMLGIILGVASLVGMAAIIKGMENGMRESMIAMGGADKFILEEEDVPVEQEHLADQAPGRTILDVQALRAGATLLQLVSPEMAVQGVTVTRGDKMVVPSETVGVWPAVVAMNLHTLEHGRFFSALDEEYAHPVCVIGTGIRDELFGSPDQTGLEIVPLGETINISGQPFTIIGMFTRYEGEQERKQREQAKLRAKEPKAGPARNQQAGRGGNWAFRGKITRFTCLSTNGVRQVLNYTKRN